MKQFFKLLALSAFVLGVFMWTELKAEDRVKVFYQPEQHASLLDPANPVPMFPDLTVSIDATTASALDPNSVWWTNSNVRHNGIQYSYTYNVEQGESKSVTERVTSNVINYGMWEIDSGWTGNCSGYITIMASW